MGNVLKVKMDVFSLKADHEKQASSKRARQTGYF